MLQLMKIQTVEVILLLVVSWCSLIYSLDNGLALTPPMGWLSWERFRCNLDCENDPHNCISEDLYKQMADRIVADGYKDAGYEYVCVDDCWLAPTRDANGRLQPDPNRFPSGMKALADYIHSKGLKFGIYEDFGVKTCAGYPGSEYYLELDAQTFADWGVDLLKFDGCGANAADFAYGYPAMTFYLNKTGRPILYSCEWPGHAHNTASYSAVRKYCNTWRNYIDINDNWQSLVQILVFYGKDQHNFSAYAGPGGWNDPDQLCIGDFALSLDQERTHMGMWAIFAAPLLMSNDLRNIRKVSRDLLLNKRLIAVNQDPLGIQGKLVYNKTVIRIWTKPITPTGSYAIAFVNFDGGGRPTHLTLKCSDVGLTNAEGYDVTDTFTGDAVGTYKPGDEFDVFVNPTGIIMFTAIPLQTN
ncbi:hypothetical protein SNE40_016426 [Patella caerulea]|uniref:Alpha-galactosidase n=1 Tax=Patella caerulea TaxID=87958 RepID=A0AAN8JE44_PATCE